MGRLLLHELRFRMKAVVGWSIGMIAFGAVYITVYPQAAEQMGDLADLALYEVLGMSLGNFESYIASVVINFLPILLGVFAIITGTKTLAGEEEEGTLELVMAQPVSRFAIVTAKALSIAVSLLLILLVAAAADAALYASVREAAGADLPPARLFLVVFSAWPITAAIAMMSLFLGALLPKRRAASMVAAVVLIAGYFGETLAGMVPSLERVKLVSLFTWFDSTAAVFTDGVQAKDLVVLLAVTLAFYGLAVASFVARDVTVGAWPRFGSLLPKRDVISSAR